LNGTRGVVGGSSHGCRAPGMRTVATRPVASVIAIPPVRASVSRSSLSQRGVHPLGNQRSLTTISA
jgi:hypothetical protein